MRLLLPSIASLLFTTACAGSSVCDERDDPNHGTCTAYTGLSADAADYRDQCDGTWRPGSCPSTDRIGGCSSDGFAGFETTWVTWHYAGSAGGFETRKSVETACSGRFVAP